MGQCGPNLWHVTLFVCSYVSGEGCGGTVVANDGVLPGGMRLVFECV